MWSGPTDQLLQVEQLKKLMLVLMERNQQVVIMLWLKGEAKESQKLSSCQFLSTSHTPNMK